MRASESIRRTQRREYQRAVWATGFLTGLAVILGVANWHVWTTPQKVIERPVVLRIRPPSPRYRPPTPAPDLGMARPAPPTVEEGRTRSVPVATPAEIAAIEAVVTDVYDWERIQEWNAERRGRLRDREAERRGLVSVDERAANIERRARLTQWNRTLAMYRRDQAETLKYRRLLWEVAATMRGGAYVNYAAMRMPGWQPRRGMPVGQYAVYSPHVLSLEKLHALPIIRD